jgi:putative transposase
MARIARVIVPGIPHHIIQRGNRRQNVFLKKRDQQAYLDILKEQADKHHLSIWAYCLMSNHVHIIGVPETEASLAHSIGETHRRYTRMINFREGWRGYLWQGRYSSYPMDEKHLLSAARYIEQNPVRAKAVSRPEEWEWSSARHHLGLTEDPLISRNDLLPDLVDDWKSYLTITASEAERFTLQRHERTGRPLGDLVFIEQLEKALNRILTPQKRGPKGPWKHKNSKDGEV